MAGTFAAVFVALWVGHSLGDHWVQTQAQASTKGNSGWTGRRACVTHVATLTLTKLAVLVITIATLGFEVSEMGLAAGTVLDVASHYWADRRTTLARLAAITGHSEFYGLGTPRPGKDDNPSLGTGAYALDQSWHLAWLWVAALVMTTL